MGKTKISSFFVIYREEYKINEEITYYDDDQLIGFENENIVVLNVYRKRNSKGTTRKYCECKCKKCGSDFDPLYYKVSNGSILSCGCDRISPRRKDITGQKFGRLTVEKMLYNYKNSGKTYCECICECGNTKTVFVSNLKKGATKSCGCLEEESRFTRKHYKDIKGDKFGDLTVIRLTGEKASNGSAMWECECSCGNTRVASYSDLKRGRVISCGCRDFESVKRNLKNEKFGKLTAIHPTHKNGHTAWICNCDCGNTDIIVNTMDLTHFNTTSCGCVSTSAPEHYISILLNAKNANYKPQYTFPDCKNIRKLPFDFCIFNDDGSIKALIEYQGRQHYEAIDFFGGIEGLRKRKINDKIKKDYCENNNLKLIAIPYTCCNEEIEEIINEILDPVTITA